MFKKIVKVLFGSKASAKNYQEDISFAFDMFIVGYDFNDDDYIFNSILDRVKDEDLANDLYVFIPIAITREWLKEWPISFSDYFMKSIGGGQYERVSLNRVPVYGQIQAFLKMKLQKLSQEDAMKVLAVSAEFKVINSYLNDGGQLENLNLSAPVVG